MLSEEGTAYGTALLSDQNQQCGACGWLKYDKGILEGSLPAVMEKLTLKDAGGAAKWTSQEDRMEMKSTPDYRTF